MESKRIKILFSGGGTGGHLFPALAIADEIKDIRPDAEILFVGTRNKIESRIVPQKGYAFRTIWISGFHRGIRLSNLLFPLKVVVSLIQSFFLIRSFNPQVVVGTGGYVAGPVVFVASLMGISTVVHESNSYPGVTTKFLSRRATKVFITFETTKHWLKRQDNVELVGNPTRKELETVNREEAAKYFMLDPNRKTLLVFGGSLGAISLNRAIRRMINDLIDRAIQIIWQTGERDFEIRGTSEGMPKHLLWVGPFIDRMDYAYAAADLVVCRAGATTLAELTRLGKPAILVPYPHAAGDHQVVNARTLVDAGAVEMIYDHEIDRWLKEKILQLITNDNALQRMGDNARKLGRPNAGKEIAQKIVNLVS